MSTNYYAVVNLGQYRGEYEISRGLLHICKNLLTYHGLFHEDTLCGNITTWEEWKKFLLSECVRYVEDEYGRVLESEEFIILVDEFIMDEAKQRNIAVFEKCNTDFYKLPTRRGWWLDEENFVFYGGSFS